MHQNEKYATEKGISYILVVELKVVTQHIRSFHFDMLLQAVNCYNSVTSGLIVYPYMVTLFT